MNFIKIFLFLVFSSATYTEINLTSNADNFPRLTKMLHKEVKKDRYPGFLTLINQNGTTIYSDVVGYSNLEKEELLKVLWQLVAVDNVIDPYEENLYFKTERSSDNPCLF